MPGCGSGWHPERPAPALSPGPALRAGPARWSSAPSAMRAYKPATARITSGTVTSANAVETAMLAVTSSCATS